MWRAARRLPQPPISRIRCSRFADRARSGSRTGAGQCDVTFWRRGRLPPWPCPAQRGRRPRRYRTPRWSRWRSRSIVSRRSRCRYHRARGGYFRARALIADMAVRRSRMTTQRRTVHEEALRVDKIFRAEPTARRRTSRSSPRPRRRGRRSATMPAPAHSRRAVSPASCAHRSAIANSPSPLASIHPTWEPRSGRAAQLPAPRSSPAQSHAESHRLPRCGCSSDASANRRRRIEGAASLRRGGQVRDVRKPEQLGGAVTDDICGD